MIATFLAAGLGGVAHTVLPNASYSPIMLQ